MMYSVVIIDGRSGSGKTTLAAELAERLSMPGQLSMLGQPAQTLHLDSLYPGWDGLAEGSASVARVLEQQWYQPYNWAASQFSDSRITLDPCRPLVIEGCGSLTEANLEAARQWAGGSDKVRAIWLECDVELRHARALARDGGMFAPHWETWAAQEDAHFALHEPWKLATEVVHSE